MTPERLRTLFWDTNIEHFDPRTYPRYAIERVLEHGDEDAVAWLLRLLRVTRSGPRCVMLAGYHLDPQRSGRWSSRSPPRMSRRSAADADPHRRLLVETTISLDWQSCPSPTPTGIVRSCRLVGLTRP